MRIIRNSAKCTACGEEIESVHRHDFNAHWCKVEPTPGTKWEGDKIVPSGEMTWRFAVDGGKEYLRRVGKGWVDTSQTEETD